MERNWSESALDLPALLPLPKVGLFTMMRLGLFQMGLGMMSVLLFGLLNRVLIKELGIPGTIASLVLAVTLFVAPARIWFGHGYFCAANRGANCIVRELVFTRQHGKSRGFGIGRITGCFPLRDRRHRRANRHALRGAVHVDEGAVCIGYSRRDVARPCGAVFANDNIRDWQSRLRYGGGQWRKRAAACKQ